MGPLWRKLPWHFHLSCCDPSGKCYWSLESSGLSSVKIAIPSTELIKDAVEAKAKSQTLPMFCLFTHSLAAYCEPVLSKTCEGPWLQSVGSETFVLCLSLWWTLIWACISSCTFYNWEEWAEQLMLFLAQRLSKTDLTVCPGSHAWQWWSSLQSLQSSWLFHSSTSTGQDTVFLVYPSQCDTCFWGAQDMTLWIEEYNGHYCGLEGDS